MGYALKKSNYFWNPPYPIWARFSVPTVFKHSSKKSILNDGISQNPFITPPTGFNRKSKPPGSPTQIPIKLEPELSINEHNDDDFDTNYLSV